MSSYHLLEIVGVSPSNFYLLSYWGGGGHISNNARSGFRAGWNKNKILTSQANIANQDFPEIREMGEHKWLTFENCIAYEDIIWRNFSSISTIQQKESEELDDY